MMPKFPKKLKAKLASRAAANALRHLGKRSDLVDFSSNDYLGFSKESHLATKADTLLANFTHSNGSTGSRLLSGNPGIHEALETYLE